MVNKVTLIGRLGADPEVRHLDSGVMVARLSVATNEYYKDKEGNFQETTEWHNAVAWREIAERAEKQLKKGSLVYIEGKISYRKYNDKDGQERYATDIVVNNFRSLDKREGGAGDAARFPSAENAPPARVSSNVPATADTAPAEGDDLPF
ncbi:MAG: single-stranded DNA-binding protein [Saprospiraceae bacterium]|nr:single-stranded DNA-binding protein [Saprospiraceae bacterium]